MNACVNGKTLEEMKLMRDGASLAFANFAGPKYLAFASIGLVGAWFSGLLTRLDVRYLRGHAAQESTCNVGGRLLLEQAKTRLMHSMCQVVP
jgi:hypothetical protein